MKKIPTLIIILFLSFSSIAQENVNKEIKATKTATVISGKIGKANHHTKAKSKTLTVEIPIGSQIIAIRAYFANQPFGKGESVFKPIKFTLTPIVSLDGQVYDEWSGSWAYAEFISQASDSVTVKFYTWNKLNSRKAKLEVDYK